MRNFLTWLSRRRFPYEPLITVEISASRIIHNLQEFIKIAPNGRIAPVLKSNAYGHGLFEVAKILEHGIQRSDLHGSIPFLIVDSYFEAIALRSRGIKIPLLVIGYTRPEIISGSNLKHTSFTVTSLNTLKQIETGRRFVRIHLKIDTGMHRQGILPSEIDDAIEILRENQLILLEGICSHLSDADNADDSSTDGQIHVWNNAVNKFRAAFPSLKYWHLSASDGHRFTSDIEANVSRLGIGLYGLSDGSSFKPPLNMKPALEMKTIITDVKQLKPGESVGYSNTFKASANMTIATIPVGYYEGLDRRLSNSGTILVGKDRIPCPIIGRLSMNITIIDVSDAGEVKIGDVAIAISNESNDANSIAAIAKICGTITYEVAVKIPAHLKRVVVS